MNVKKILKKILNYIIKTFNGMALGLFSTLIIGVIFKQIGELLEIPVLLELFLILKSLMGVGIGIGIAWSLGLIGLPLIAGAISGGIAGSISNGEPMTVYLTTIFTIEVVRFVLRRKTSVDIIIIPFFTTLVALGIAHLISPPMTFIVESIGDFIKTATTYQPFIMGVIIAVVMGMALTAPISSAAIAISIGLSGIAGGAAVVGCSVQMIGFAVMSRKDNRFGEVISIAIGTSMLQFKNILRKPIIWLPTILTSAILGPLATLVFKTESTKIGSGMGTAALVGQIDTLDVMGYTMNTLIAISVLHFILPIILVFGLDGLFRYKKWILPGDLALENKE